MHIHCTNVLTSLHFFFFFLLNKRQLSVMRHFSSCHNKTPGMMTANTYKAIIRQQPDVKCAPLFGLRLGLAQLLAASQKRLTSTQKKQNFSQQQVWQLQQPRAHTERQLPAFAHPSDNLSRQVGKQRQRWDARIYKAGVIKYWQVCICHIYNKSIYT